MLIEYLSYNYETQLQLAVCNILNGKWETVLIDAYNFTQYSTSYDLSVLEK